MALSDDLGADCDRKEEAVSEEQMQLVNTFDAFRRMGLEPHTAAEAARGRETFPLDLHDLDEAEDGLSLEEIVRRKAGRRTKPKERKSAETKLHAIQLREQFERLGLSEAQAAIAAEGR
jgi:hypothetical protein